MIFVQNESFDMCVLTCTFFFRVVPYYICFLFHHSFWIHIIYEYPRPGAAFTFGDGLSGQLGRRPEEGSEGGEGEDWETPG